MLKVYVYTYTRVLRRKLSSEALDSDTVLAIVDNDFGNLLIFSFKNVLKNKPYTRSNQIKKYRNKEQISTPIYFPKSILKEQQH